MKNMEIDYSKQHWDKGACPKVDCRKNSCKCGLKKVFLASALGDDSKDSPIAPKNGDYCNAIVVYEANGHIYIYSSEGIPTMMSSDVAGIEELEEAIRNAQSDIVELDGDLLEETRNRESGDGALQEEIDAIKNSPDVVDIVATYAALQTYDTSKLGDNDIVRVLADEQHDGASTYYRWNKQSSTWTYIGEVGDYYTKGQVDTLLADKQDELTAGANISIAQIDNDLVISATDTTYSAFTGTDGQTAGASGLVPAPATTDAGKFLKADGTWAIAGGGGIKTLTTADYNYPVNNPTYINLGLLAPGIYFVDDNAMIYNGTNVNKYRGSYSFIVTEGDGDSSLRNIMVIYPSAAASSNEYKIRFFYTFTSNPYPWSARGNVLSADYITDNLTTNNANRVLSAAQGVALKSLIDGLVISGAGAPTTSTVGTVGQLYEDTTNGKLYQCISASGGTYAWSEVGGGGITPVQTTGTSTTDVMSQNATASMVFDDPGTDTKIKIGAGTSVSAQHYNMAIGYSASANGAGAMAIGHGASSRIYGIALGDSAKAGNTSSHVSTIAIGYNAQALGQGAIAIGRDSTASGTGVMDIGSSDTSYGYSSSNYRLLSGVHDPVNAHDAATKGYVDTAVAVAGYNFNSQVVQSAYEDPEVTKSLSEAEYQALEDVCVNLGKLYYSYSGNGYYSRDDSIYYECTEGSGINIYSNSPNINGSFSFSYNSGEPEVVFTPN